MLGHMNALKAHLKNGQIVLDEPAEIAEGEPLYVLKRDDGADMNDDERAAIDRALDEADEDLAAGRVVSEEEMWAALRALK
jgi:uridine phosphorylase